MSDYILKAKQFCIKCVIYFQERCLYRRFVFLHLLEIIDLMINVSLSYSYI